MSEDGDDELLELSPEQVSVRSTGQGASPDTSRGEEEDDGPSLHAPTAGAAVAADVEGDAGESEGTDGTESDGGSDDDGRSRDGGSDGDGGAEPAADADKGGQKRPYRAF